MKKAETLDWIKRTRIVPVVRAASADEALRLADALVEGGIDILEITMTVPGAIEAIRQLAQREDVLVGAGTVLDPETANQCIDAGARFIVSPALNTETVKACNEAGILCAPGALTPTEVVAAHQAGGDVIKVFPCDSLGGAGYLKSLKAPLPHIPLMPTGGVSLATIRAFFEAGAIAVGAGSSLVDPSLTHEDLVARARAFRLAASPP
ncbi:bifunctional 4-hydroxy-2-oxoglutarate aldolase/2-dehydro-3-deoxy-phosphogluconate aldolase [bacterium]|nr:MAG: bifunctional 4-hydroxy-2-oxoglutarate aldolase/2-dehydro-3-deoxy-phosphogluconate aldolase [bacterium]